MTRAEICRCYLLNTGKTLPAGRNLRVEFGRWNRGRIFIPDHLHDEKLNGPKVISRWRGYLA